MWHMTAPGSSESHSQVTLSHDALMALLEQAAERGAARALRRESTETFGNREAAERFYGRPDRIEAWRQLRIAHPEIDEVSTGTGAARQWTREAIDMLIAKFPQIRRRAQRSA